MIEFPENATVHQMQKLYAFLSSSKIYGLRGQIQFALDYCGSKLEDTFETIIEILDSSAIENFNWHSEDKIQELEKRLHEFIARGDAGTLKGMWHVANVLFDGDLWVTHKFATLLLGRKTVKNLQWKLIDFHLSKEKFLQISYELIHTTRYKGATGQQQFCEDFQISSKNQAYWLARTLLRPSEFSNLGWSITNQKRLYSKIPTKVAMQIVKKPQVYRGPQGYMDFANEFCDGSMNYAFKAMSAKLGPTRFKTLEWTRRVDLKADQMASLKKYLETQSLEKLKGLDGQCDVATKYCNQKLKTAYDALFLLDPKLLKELDWKFLSTNARQLRGHSESLEQIVQDDALSNTDKFLRFAHLRCNRSLSKAIGIAKALLPPPRIKKLRWKSAWGFVVYEDFVEILDYLKLEPSLKGVQGWESTKARFSHINPRRLWQIFKSFEHLQEDLKDWPLRQDLPSSN